MIKNYSNWLNESLDNSTHRATEIVALYCLEGLSPTGGNNPGYKYWKRSSHLFDNDGPDLWLNCGDFGGKIDHELEIVSRAFHKTPREVLDIFKNYKLVPSDISPDETIFEIKFGAPVDFWEIPDRAPAIARYYEKELPEMIRELREKHRTVLTGKKFGL